MNFAERLAAYHEIEQQRNSRVIAFVTSDRPAAETQIAQDCVSMFVDILDEIGPTPKISLVMHTNGGDTSTAWRLVNLIRSFCDDFEVIVPMKAMSAGTLMSLGANEIVMTKQAVLGPIDPSLNHPLGPQFHNGNQLARIPVSVEAVRGYLDAANQLSITDPQTLGHILIDLANKVHPLVLGQIFRTRDQIRFLAAKLLRSTVQDSDKVGQIIDFLCADSGSHDYTLNRREAEALGLNVTKPSTEFYGVLKSLYNSYSAELKLLEPFNPMVELGAAQQGAYQLIRGLIESPTGNNCYGFVSEGVISRNQIPNPAEPMGFSEVVTDNRTFEGWRAI